MSLPRLSQLAIEVKHSGKGKGTDVAILRQELLIPAPPNLPASGYYIPQPQQDIEERAEGANHGNPE